MQDLRWFTTRTLEACCNQAKKAAEKARKLRRTTEQPFFTPGCGPDVALSEARSYIVPAGASPIKLRYIDVRGCRAWRLDGRKGFWQAGSSSFPRLFRLSQDPTRWLPEMTTPAAFLGRGRKI